MLKFEESIHHFYELSEYYSQHMALLRTDGSSSAAYIKVNDHK